MRKADLVRAIFVKLRQEVPAEFSDGDVLRFANFFVETRTTDPDLLREFGRAVDGHSLALAPVDEAMSDGGWRILEYEGRLRRGREGHDVAYQRTLATLIERYLGPEWRHHQWNGPL